MHSTDGLTSVHFTAVPIINISVTLHRTRYHEILHMLRILSILQTKPFLQQAAPLSLKSNKCK